MNHIQTSGSAMVRWAGVAAGLIAAWSGSAQAQSANRAVSSNDITMVRNSDGTWTVSARALLANTAAAPANLSGTLTVGVNGVPVRTVTKTMMVDGGGSCAATCAVQPGCLACLPSVIPGLSCMCYSRSIDSGAVVVPVLEPGDVITATVTAAAGSMAEVVTSDDWGYQVVPNRLHHNRVMDASTLRYEASPYGGYMITGEIRHQYTSGASGNLSSNVFVLEGGILIGGGHPGSGGSCGSTDVITYGPGHPLGPAGPGGPMIFTCEIFCLNCRGYDVNVCVPPNITPVPMCECQQLCTSRIVPGPRWGVEVPQLDPDAFVTVRLAPAAGSDPEIDTSDDAVTVRIGDITPGCPADYNQDGGIDGSDVGAFFTDWEAGNASADLNLDGGIDGADVGTFFEHWEAGC